MKLNRYVLLIVLACLWGPSFMLIKIAVNYASPLAISTFRILIGTVALFGILRLKKASLSMGSVPWHHFAVSGILNMALPYSLISWSEQHIDSALAGILNGLTPFFTILISFQWHRNEKPGGYKVLGMLIGFAGLCCLLWPYLSESNSNSTLGIVLVATAAASYGAAAIYIKKNLAGQRPLIAPAYQLLFAGATLLPFLLAFGNPKQLTEVDAAFWWSVCSLGLLGTALAYIVYFKIIENSDASFLTLVTYIMPAISVVLGIVFLEERVYWNTYAGGLFIVVGVWTTNRKS